MTAPCPPHRFRLEEPAGPTVKGVCTGCREERIYRSGEPEPTATGAQVWREADERKLQRRRARA